MVTSNLIKAGQLYEILPDGSWNFFLDSSMLRQFLECEQSFKYKYVDHIRLKGGPNFKMAVGSWWSSFMELYYNAHRAGTNLKLVDVIEYAAHAWDELNMDALGAEYPASLQEFGGKNGAVVMATEYFQWARPLDLARWTVVSVEEGSGRLRELLITDGRGDVRVYYIVKPDLFVIEDGVLTPVDHKTKDFINPKMIHSYKPHHQMLSYINAAQELASQLGLKTTVDRCTINVAARKVKKNGDSARFQRIPVQYSQSQIEEWRHRVLEAARRLRYCIYNNVWGWNDNACHVYAGCMYRPIDSQPPASRQVIINSSFVKGSPWTPYKTEEEEDN